MIFSNLPGLMYNLQNKTKEHFIFYFINSHNKHIKYSTGLTNRFSSEAYWQF